MKSASWLLFRNVVALGCVASCRPANQAEVRAPEHAVWRQQDELFVGDGAAGDAFGSSAAVSGDIAVLGAPPRASFKGAAYVFARSGSSWFRRQELVASDGAADDGFGSSVAVSGDTVVVGAPGKASFKGAAYVFARSGSSWSQQQELIAGDEAAHDQFGSSVAVSGDTVMVGAPGKTSNNAQDGAAYVFVRAGSSWSQQQKLTARGGALDDHFGDSVAVSGDTAVVGAHFKGWRRGAAYVFSRSGSSWSQQQELTASDGAANDQFGTSVTVSGDTVVVGAPGQASFKGAAYVFARSGSSWSQQQELNGRGGASWGGFGFQVSLSGATIVVGAPLTGSGGAGGRPSPCGN